MVIELDLLRNLRSNGLARTTPCGKRVDDDDLVFGNGLLELGNAVQMMDR